MAVGPTDTLNSVLINSVVFAFVPMLTACHGRERAALFLKLSRYFLWVSAAITGAVVLSAPWLMRALAPGLDPAYFGTAVTVLRILAFSPFLHLGIIEKNNVSESGQPFCPCLHPRVRRRRAGPRGE